MSSLIQYLEVNDQPEQGNEDTCSVLTYGNEDKRKSEVPDGLLANEWDGIQDLLQEGRYYPTRHEARNGIVASNQQHQWGVNEF